MRVESWTRSSYLKSELAAVTEVSMSQQSVEVISGLYDSFGRGDVPAVLGQMDQQIEWNEAENFIYADRNPYVGPQAVLDGVFMRLGAEGGGFYATAEQVV